MLDGRGDDRIGHPVLRYVAERAPIGRALERPYDPLVVRRRRVVRVLGLARRYQEHALRLVACHGHDICRRVRLRKQRPHVPVTALDRHDEVLARGCRLRPVQAQSVRDPRLQICRRLYYRADRRRLHGNARRVGDIALGVHGQRPGIGPRRQHRLLAGAGRRPEHEARLRAAAAGRSTSQAGGQEERDAAIILDGERQSEVLRALDQRLLEPDKFDACYVRAAPRDPADADRRRHGVIDDQTEAVSWPV
jgi:hypothetical protein